MKSPVILLVCCLFLPACDGLLGLGDSTRPADLWISHTAIILDTGEHAQLKALGRHRAGDLRQQFTEADWSSADEAVVRVSPSGRIEGIGPGRTTVWVRVGDREDSATVVVRAPGAEPSAEWRFVDVGGQDATCGITADGRTHCWGGDYWGQLGQGTRDRATRTLAPVTVRGITAIRQISVGGGHTCALTDGPDIFCWGKNVGGQLGAGYSSKPQPSPTPVQSSVEFASVWTGATFTCALDTTGGRYCWGDNIVGQLGIGVVGVEERRTAPTPGADSITFAQLDLGSYHGCGLDREGRAYCWGTNESAEIGAGSGGPKYVPVPVPVAGGHRYHTISAAGSATCAITTSGATYCWGSNGSGQLGVEGIAGSFVPVRLEHDPGFVQISGGGATFCGLTAAGKAYCWGTDRTGKLGTDVGVGQCEGAAPFPCSSRPLPVSGGLTFSQISVGGSSACGITTDRALYCWGSNESGQLGIGSLIEQSSVPVRVADPL